VVILVCIYQGLESEEAILETKAQGAAELEFGAMEFQ
jgi:hypothetical protein